MSDEREEPSQESLRPCKAKEKGEKEDIRKPNNQHGITEYMDGPRYDVRRRLNDLTNGLPTLQSPRNNDISTAKQ
jgi:hypothetical protein